MKVKEKYVVFHKDGARVYVGKKPKTSDPMVKNPDLTLVLGVNPNNWELSGSKVVPKFGYKGYIHKRPEYPILKKIGYVLLGLLIGLLL